MPHSRITNDWVLERFDRIYPVYRVAFARLLFSLRHGFDGDLDAMLIMLTLSLGTGRTGWADALFDEFTKAATQLRLTNTQSIALASGIPRETVRRKLAALEARGWVCRDADGNWAPTAAAAADLRDASHETVHFIRAIVAAALAGDRDPSLTE